MSKEIDWPETYFNAGKRTHLTTGPISDWFVGYGEDEHDLLEGPWHAMIVLAAQILSSENTRLAVEHSELPEELYQPELGPVAKDIRTHTGQLYDFGDIIDELGESDE